MKKLTHEEIFKALLDGKAILNKDTGYSYVLRDRAYISLQYGYRTTLCIPEDTSLIKIIEPKCRNMTLREIMDKYGNVEFNVDGDLMVQDGDLYIGIKGTDLHLLGKEFEEGEQYLSSRFVIKTYE